MKPFSTLFNLYVPLNYSPLIYCLQSPHKKMKAFFCHRSGCSRSFTNPYNLKRHTLVKHLMTTAFTCNICNKRLSSKQSLVEHTTLHTGEIPFKCSSCGAQFRFSSQASKHSRTHRLAERDNRFLELKVTEK